MIEINKIYNENCLETMARMQDEFIDLTVTSPPYDNLREYNGYSFHFESIAKELYRVTKCGGVVVWIVNDKRVNGNKTLSHFKQAINFQNTGFNVLDVMIWKKSNPMPFIQKDQYTPSYELMFILTKGKLKKFNPLKERCKYANKIVKTRTTNKESIRRPNKTTPTKEFKIKSNVWETVVAGTNYGHPAIFPEKLANDHILSWSNENDLVYDCFMGSGTTAKMAILNNRKYIGSELSEEYCEIIKQRLSNTQNLFNT
jgi:site-specific DNA-methyltransferase (adenine-specific)